MVILRPFQVGSRNFPQNKYFAPPEVCPISTHPKARPRETPFQPLLEILLFCLVLRIAQL
jgi:hypothetical protein